MKRLGAASMRPSERIVLNPAKDGSEDGACVLWRAFTHSQVAQQRDFVHDTDSDRISEQTAVPQLQDLVFRDPFPNNTDEIKTIRPQPQWVHETTFRVVFGLRCEGPPGHVHGGCIGLLHETVGSFAASESHGSNTEHACPRLKQQHAAKIAQMRIEYLRPVPLQGNDYSIHLFRCKEQHDRICTVLTSQNSTRIFNRGQILQRDQALEIRGQDLRSEVSNSSWLSAMRTDSSLNDETQMLRTYQDHIRPDQDGVCGLDFTDATQQLAWEYFYRESDAVFFAVYTCGELLADGNQNLRPGWVLSCVDQVAGFYAGIHASPGRFFVTAQLDVSFAHVCRPDVPYLYEARLAPSSGRTLDVLVTVTDPALKILVASAAVRFLSPSKL
eukprot:TRINITY_DN5265_c0_g1_i2.p1 TRINITY_DN5265_c0_g1~~TRINITY_DN5265_c0_g1_i2.p1  ORF type:complete len:385 (-),score=57.79 TRINITY_DN5265_c0_g1_i2:73-1227(-)